MRRVWERFGVTEEQKQLVREIEEMAW